MQTLYSVAGQTLNNRNISFTDRTATLTAGQVVVFRLRTTDMRAGASLAVSMDVTFPGSATPKHFEILANAVGAYQRGGWRGDERAGTISASGIVDATGRVTFDGEIVAFEANEDIPEWS